MKPLSKHDLAWCIRLLPPNVREAMKKYGTRMVVAGGFIRSAIAHEDVNDVDIFAPDKATAEMLALALLPRDRKLITTDNAFTVIGNRYTLQFIHRWTYDRPEKVVESFDFTIARGAIWYDAAQWTWCTLCDDDFYADLAAKRLVYCSPLRNEDAGGSMLRVLKFYQRGYRIPLDSLGAVIARLAISSDWKQIESEERAARVLTAKLVEVDPNIDPEHISHLPTLK